MRLAEQLHACRLQHPAALLVIATAAGCDQVLPAVAATQTARDDMVQRQLHILAAAILAGVMVTAEDLLLVQFDFGSGAAHHALQADH